MSPRLFPLPLLFGAAIAAQDPGAVVHHEDLVRHYANVERELRAAPFPADPQLAARRAIVLDLLQIYRKQCDFGVVPSGTDHRLPQFIDADGRRCAVAFLLDRTGYGELTLAVAKHRNDAWLVELLDSRELTDWLGTHGITAAEAARIQVPTSWARRWMVMPPREPPPPPREWQPDDAPGRSSGATTGSRSGPAATGARGTAPAAAAATAARTPARGTPVVELGSAEWSAWWDWNRDHLTLPAALGARSAAAATTSARPARLLAVRKLLATFVKHDHPAMRAAAVRALGRIGAHAELISSSLEDGAREVKLATLMALGSGGTAQNTHRLVTALTNVEASDQRSVALAALAAERSDAQSRWFAAWLRRDLDGDEALDVLAAGSLTASRQPTPELRQHAIDRLEQGSSPFARAMAAEMLGVDCGTDEIAALTRALGERNPEVRRSAALALGRSRHELALPALLTACELERDQTTSGLLTIAIGHHGGGVAGDFLATRLTEGPKALRAMAALGIGLTGRRNLVGNVADAWKEERNHDHHGAYLIALGMLRAIDHRAAMATALRTGSTSTTRSAAATALGMIGDAADFDALRVALTTDPCPAVRADVASALVPYGTRAVASLLDAIARDPVAEVRAAVTWVLASIDDPKVSAALERVAIDASAPIEVRAAGLAGLGRHHGAMPPELPKLRFLHNHTVLPAMCAWALMQEQ